ncbi:MAG: elongation factor P [Parcubacteria group bacterium Gr01-1014_18]|nr:MAG: elongation factor P [Parcubacteria group bacterium Greene0416_36]TSC80733.1 MAG: elongation factor P [Parcubacteria group bacterium Gr01-1014_18]TSC98656.1 MAG: elongation factor P [Parcubacteria group bacterium Greene1014_20]TSD07184.1 MAG: elongation factor P [Parcubacteria group bacterium Greene0714_2]
MTAGDFHKGMAMMYENDPWIVSEVNRSKMAQRRMMCRIKMRNVKNGKTLEVTFRSDEVVQEADVTRRAMQFTYKDATNYYFMDDNFEQFQVSTEAVGEDGQFLVAEAKVDGLFLGDDLVTISLPKKVSLKVVNTAPGVKGDSAGAVMKQAELETGATINVPLFIKEGEVVIINTENREYVGREQEEK